jgi:hypothetical protein
MSTKITAALIVCCTRLLAGTYTAASCNQADVNAVINGPTHTAVDGDIINIPAGSCTWSTGIKVPGSIGITIIGNGTPNSTPGTSGAGIVNTTITSNVSGSVITANPTYGNSATRLSTLKITLGTSTSVPVTMVGTCTSSGCPNIRLDNLIVPTSGFCSVSDASFAIIANVFGVLDHNTVGDVASTCNGIDFANVNHSIWQGVGVYGDNSWFSPNTFGSAQAVYLENNVFHYAFGTDTDGSDSYGHVGGGRLVCRFNTFNDMPTVSACGGHGTETTGRPRGLRQAEFYENAVNSTNTSAVGLGMRSGVAISWGNTFATSGGGSFASYVTLNTERAYRPTSWAFCDGTGPYDVNDGGSQVWSGTVSSFSGSTLSVSGTPWTAGAYNFSTSSPGSTYYVVFNTTHGNLAGIASNTANQLTVSWMLSNIAGPFYGGTTFASGDSIVIFASNLYAAGTHTGSTGTSTLTDSTKAWTTNQWFAYSVLDVSNGYAYQVVSNTATTATPNVAPSSASGGAWPGWTNGDQYAILRATRCLDQPSSYGGSLISGEVPAPLPTAETLSPSYEFFETAGTGGTPTGNMTFADSLALRNNRDYYFTAVGFNGTSGTGAGTLANRPSTCTPRVGYWATDQGSWNQSGSGGQGELFICTATNTWTPYYTPFTYPHPLTQGTGNIVPGPPTSLFVTVH